MPLRGGHWPVPLSSRFRVAGVSAKRFPVRSVIVFSRASPALISHPQPPIYTAPRPRIASSSFRLTLPRRRLPAPAVATTVVGAPMSARHPRQSDRDIRLHDPHGAHPHAQSLPPPPHAHGHPLHMNGTSMPSTPLAPGAAPPPPAAIVTSPAVPNGASSRAAPPTSMQKLAEANESTWLLIGEHCIAFGGHGTQRVTPDHLADRQSRRADGQFGTRALGVRARPASQSRLHIRPHTSRWHRTDQRELSQGTLPHLILSRQDRINTGKRVYPFLATPSPAYIFQIESQISRYSPLGSRVFPTRPQHAAGQRRSLECPR